MHSASPVLAMVILEDEAGSWNPKGFKLLNMTWRLVLGVLLTLGSLSAEEKSWERYLASHVSGRLENIESELRSIAGELPGLPAIPIADQGGTGGFANLHSKEGPPEGGEYSVSIRFAEAGLVDLIALVPARRYGVEGLEAQFGMPDAFSVELLDQEGKALSRVADLHDLWSDPVRAGHPFVFAVSSPVMAAGLKISARRLRLDPDVSETFVHAWAEAFAFAGERNLAANGTVTSVGGSPSLAPWQWSNAFLVDGQTTLGLPEIVGAPHQNVGWMSEVEVNPKEPVWLELDLGSVQDLDSVRLFPAKRPTSDLPSGFGFPRAFTVSVSELPFDPRQHDTMPLKTVKAGSPGHNPVSVPLGNCRGRYVKIEMTEVWKAYENFPAFVALSEVEILKGEKNLAEGAGVRTSGGIGLMIGSGSQFWSTASLTDGFGPEGKLVPARDWLLALDRREGLEARQYQLQREAAGIVESWKKTGWTVIAVFGGLGLVLLVALPIRYRSRGKRQVEEVRDRIAGDLHDEVGSNLGSIQMLANHAERRGGDSKELKRIQRIAAETVSAVRDIVWLLRPGGDHRIATVEHLRETCSIMLEPHEWKFTANEAAWQCEMRDDTNRHLFLFFRESLHNILRHAEASRVEVAVACDAKEFRLTISDDGCGIPADRLERPSTLRALRKRVEALAATFAVETQPGQGTKLELAIPLTLKRSAKRG